MLTPIIEQLKEEIKKLEKIVSELEYQEILNKAISNIKSKQHENTKGDNRPA